ncbi:glycosyltransferase 61 family protein [Belnapia rosea]|uniref:Glycosyltransferase 61 catalytic domain-containing protein n=1 Tax=Belnapia rosea TaxID=938405 RepID=A0A1G7DHD6_9PROT|nr:glycosyltransferase 61 family protein [Belnapia rosea]SDE51008.1 Protein of unknown function [Belnapia rosea]
MPDPIDETGSQILAQSLEDIPALRASLKEPPISPIKYAKLASVLNKCGKYEAAEKVARDGLGFFIDSGWLMLRLAESLFHQKRYLEAYSWACRSINAEPYKSEMYFLAINIALKMSDINCAMQIIEKSEEIFPNNPSILHILSMAFEAMGDIEKAASFEGKAAQIAPKSIYQNRAIRLYLKTNRIESAASMAETALSVAKQDLDLDSLTYIADCLPSGERKSGFLKALLHLDPHFRFVPLFKRANFSAPPYISFEDDARIVARGEQADTRLAEIFSGLSHPVAQSIKNLNCGSDVTLKQYTNVELCIFREGFCIISKSGEVADLRAPDLVSEHIDVARRMPRLDTLNELFFAGDIFGPNNYCHWFVDHLPRIVFANENFPSMEVGLTKLIQQKFHEPSLLKFGVNPNKIRALRRGRYSVNNLCVLSTSGVDFRHAFQQGNRNYANIVMEKIHSNSNLNRRRIFLGRPNTLGRNLKNIEDIKNTVEMFGLVIVDPGLYTFEEQVALMQEAEVVVGIHGAALTNLLFCKPRAKVVEIFPPRYGSWAFAIISNLRDLEYHPIVGEDVGVSGGMLTDAGRRDFFISPKKLNNLLGEVI